MCSPGESKSYIFEKFICFPSINIFISKSFLNSFPSKDIFIVSFSNLNTVLINPMHLSMGSLSFSSSSLFTKANNKIIPPITIIKTIIIIINNFCLLKGFLTVVVLSLSFIKFISSFFIFYDNKIKK